MTNRDSRPNTQILDYKPYGGSCIKATASHKPLYKIPIHELTLAAEGCWNILFLGKLQAIFLNSALAKLTSDSFYDSLTLHSRPSFFQFLPHVWKYKLTISSLFIYFSYWFNFLQWNLTDLLVTFHFLIWVFVTWVWSPLEKLTNPYI